MVFISVVRPDAYRRDRAIRDLLVGQASRLHSNISHRTVQWMARRHQIADRCPRVFSPKQWTIPISRDPLPDDLFTRRQPDDDTERTEQGMVTRLQHNPATGGDHGMTRVLQIDQRLIFLVSEDRFPEQGEDFGNRFSVFLADSRIGIKKAEPPTASDLPSDRRLSGSHEADQN
jgi:hypothetical protein